MGNWRRSNEVVDREVNFSGGNMNKYYILLIIVLIVFVLLINDLYTQRLNTSMNALTINTTQLQADIDRLQGKIDTLNAQIKIVKDTEPINAWFVENYEWIKNQKVGE